LRATIKDVSREAGVSIKTVSRFLNGERYVGAETRAKVEAAVAALGFQPHAAARALAGRRADQVALIGDAGDAERLMALFAGVRERAAAEGLRATLHPLDSAEPRGELEALIATGQLAGVVLATEAAEIRTIFAERALPVVRVSPAADPFATPHVTIDEARAAAELTAYLIALEHRRVAFLGDARATQRAAGTQAALAAADAFDPALFVTVDANFAAASEAAAQLLSRDDAPTAIVAASDEIAAAALAAAHRLGVAVPERLSVAGFGDAALARQVWPPLTTVRLPWRALGQNAADLLLGDVADDRRVLDYELVARDSTAFAT
jgi:LacI family transcriptional regulator